MRFSKWIFFSGANFHYITSHLVHFGLDAISQMVWNHRLYNTPDWVRSIRSMIDGVSPTLINWLLIDSREKTSTSRQHHKKVFLYICTLTKNLSSCFNISSARSFRHETLLNDKTRMLTNIFITYVITSLFIRGFVQPRLEFKFRGTGSWFACTQSTRRCLVCVFLN